MNTLIFEDKNTVEILPYTVEFTDRLLPGETITTPIVSVLIYSGSDPNPTALVVPGSVVTNAAEDAILFKLTGGDVGTIYIIVVAAVISSGNLYMKVGHLAVIASDPFADHP